MWYAFEKCGGKVPLLADDLCDVSIMGSRDLIVIKKYHNMHTRTDYTLYNTIQGSLQKILVSVVLSIVRRGDGIP